MRWSKRTLRLNGLKLALAITGATAAARVGGTGGKRSLPHSQPAATLFGAVFRRFAHS